MKFARRIFVLAVLALAAVGVWLAWTLAFSFQTFPREGVFVDVPRGASLRQIAGLLEQNGVVRSKVAFEALARFRGQRLQAGEYFFDHPYTGEEVRRMLAEGRIFTQPLVIPEGRTMLDIAALVAQAGLTSREDFLEVARDPAPIRDLAPHARSLEGFLFPATYQFPRHVSGRDIVAAMVRRFREVWATLPEREQLPRGFSVEQAVILASLVERETGVPAERPLVAGVFYNRLRIGMALECDPTVIYGLALEGRYTGALSKRDMRFKSPYNTYLHRGLPPGPIGNPGAASLRAALAPTQTDYLYFVADAQGGHAFSRTLREHNANVSRYRKMQADAARRGGQ